MNTRDHREFRSVLGRFASGITVLTATTPQGPAGFTCQSFSSLSLEPPLVAVMPGKQSSTWPIIAAAGEFCVNILAEDQANLSASFSRSGADKFAGVDWHYSPRGLPVLAGVSAWIECKVDAIHEGGDHFIVVGAVRSLAAFDHDPLVFHQGTYRSLSPAGERVLAN